MSARVSRSRSNQPVRCNRLMNQPVRCVISFAGCGSDVVNVFTTGQGAVKVHLLEHLYHSGMHIVAHRGLQTYAPENSLAAVAAAIEAGFDRIEVDVRATRDGVLVLLHDGTLWRTTNAGGTLVRRSAASLHDVRLANDSSLPTLREVLACCRDRAVLCLDVKEPMLGGAILDLAESVGTQIEVWSEHREVIAYAADRGAFGALISNGLLPPDGIDGLVDEARQLGARAVSFYPADVKRSVTEPCLAAGLIVMSGTPNDRPTWEYLRRLGVTRVITDRPIDCRRWLNAVPAGRSRSGTPRPQ